MNELATLFTAHQSHLRAIALRLCRDRQDAGDLLQDTYERALRFRGGLRLDGNPRSWLISILQNTFVDGWRRRRRSGTPLPVEACDTELVADSAVTDEEEALWQTFTQEDVTRALAGLSPNLRRAYVMYAVEGRSYRDIAAELAVPMGTVGTRLLRARRALRALLIKRT